MIAMPMLEMNKLSDNTLILSHIQTCISTQMNLKDVNLNLTPTLNGDQFKNTNGLMNMMVSSNGLPTVGPELKDP